MRCPSLVLVFGLPLMLAGAAGEATELTVVGEPQLVFAWADSRCATNDIPDAPARGFRDGEGAVRLFAAHFSNRSFHGASLEEVKHDCHMVFQGSGDGDPAMFDDRIWLTSFWTADGAIVHALGHAEYHGHLRPTVCPAERYMACWWNAVIQLVSSDGGRTFRRADGSRQGLVATVPYDYDPQLGRQTGYFSPSNIIERDGYWYVFVFAESYGAQRRGACLVRTDRIEDPTRWRAWDGREFTIAFTDPYADAALQPQDHVCTPVPGVSSTISSISWLPATGTFVALIAASRPAEPGGEPVSGVFYLTSADLIHWSQPRLLLAAPIMFSFSCEAAAAYAYPSLLDDSSSRNLELVGGQTFLYLTQIAVRECRLTMERNLVRYPISFRQ